MTADAPVKTRANYLPSVSAYHLNHACRLINDAFDGLGCYQVGSSLERRDFRDVDVRFVMDDEVYDREFGGNDAKWSLLCTLLSAWLSQQTGLQVDFQFQQQTDANARHAGKRSALGIFLDYPGERPSDVEDREAKRTTP